jgi:hypothetical protein
MPTTAAGDDGYFATAHMLVNVFPNYDAFVALGIGIIVKSQTKMN